LPEAAATSGGYPSAIPVAIAGFDGADLYESAGVGTSVTEEFRGLALECSCTSAAFPLVGLAASDHEVFWARAAAIFLDGNPVTDAGRRQSSQSSVLTLAPPAALDADGNIVSRHVFASSSTKVKRRSDGLPWRISR
jgi:hypothetical protein